MIRVSLETNSNATKHAFAEGFLENDRAGPPMCGQPTDDLQLKDGSILFSDD